MKTLYTFLIVALLGLSNSLYSQTLHNIDVSNFQFTPSALTIDAGDTVVWTNSLGQHNVNGTQIEFPDNPESFSNAIGPPGWSYEFVFTIPGNYSYRCDQHPSTMFGSINVIGAVNSLNELEDNTNVAFFPNPVVNQLSWKWNDGEAPINAEMSLYDISGKLIESFSLNGISSRDLSKWSEGVYTYIILENDKPIQSGKIAIAR